ncbi:MAG TPA: hypothetical protein VFM88_12110 [Vicinamibacteria bacterium]|nr:hypothetical protein [Vicinamibacteria bacterium]
MDASALLLGSLVFLASAAVRAPEPEPGIEAALHLLYDGSTDAALEVLAAMKALGPDDPLPAYFDALALAWKLEQRPETRELDAELLRRADHAIALADVRLRGAPDDVHALFARGAAHGVKSRLHLFRRERSGAAREGVRMREDLLRVVALEPGHEDARFGLALYDYYADVLPRMLKLLRLLAGLPGGDRERGLAGLRRAAHRARWHGTEAQAQLYEILAFYEEDHDQALAAIRSLREQYPGSPLWGLKLTEHLRDRLSLYRKAADLSQEVARNAAGGHPNYAPLVGRMADLALGHALLLDLRFEEARAALLRVTQAGDVSDGLSARAQLLAGESLELEDARAAALPHYRAAAASRDPDVSRAARNALDRSLPAPRVAATPHLARGRRLLEEGRDAEAHAAFAEAARCWPESQEAALRLAARDLAAGAAGRARRTLEGLLGRRRLEPSWVRPEATLLLAGLREGDDRAAAVVLYKTVWERPGGDEARRREAARALGRLGAAPESAPRSPSEP